MAKKTQKSKKRGGGEETPLQKQIREELERILVVFTLDLASRKKYTKKSFFDNTSTGAQLIDALRDLYSSKSMKFSAKASVRNELIVRIIKLLIDEPKLFREINPNRGAYQHKVRVPIIPPLVQGIPVVSETVFAGISLPSAILNKASECVGNICNLARTITDDDAFNNLKRITKDIDLIENSLYNVYKEAAQFFNNKSNVPNEKIADILIKKLQINSTYKNMIASEIKKQNLLYFISNLNYLIKQDYDNDYVNNVIFAVLLAYDESIDDEDEDENILGGDKPRYRRKTSKNKLKKKSKFIFKILP